MSSKTEVIKTIAVLGKPGSGKGTQAQYLADKLEFTFYSSGDTFRKLRLRNDILGEKVREVYDQGLLFPGWFASYLFEKALFKLGKNEGIVFEGMGRSVEEAEMFDTVTSWLGREYVVVELVVSDEEVTRRHIKRGRDESDKPERVKTRLEEYQTKTAKAIVFFKEREKIVKVNGEQTRDEVFAEMCTALNVS